MKLLKIYLFFDSEVINFTFQAMKAARHEIDLQLQPLVDLARVEIPQEDRQQEDCGELRFSEENVPLSRILFFMRNVDGDEIRVASTKEVNRNKGFITGADVEEFEDGNLRKYDILDVMDYTIIVEECTGPKNTEHGSNVTVSAGKRMKGGKRFINGYSTSKKIYLRALM